MFLWCSVKILLGLLVALTEANTQETTTHEVEVDEGVEAMTQKVSHNGITCVSKSFR